MLNIAMKINMKIGGINAKLLKDEVAIFWAYVVKRLDIFGDPFKLVYDGKSTLYTVEKLRLNQVAEEA
ncbi:histone H3, embryonic, partial [Trichinella spiralis]|uniref:histone H3, embryonic n=1 Tax=Trichinella spiralis TaxID=6334 RepID=UPI0001EFCB5C